MNKRLDAMRQNPKAGWTISDVAAVSRDAGVLCDAARGGGSHYKLAPLAEPDPDNPLQAPDQADIHPYARRVHRCRERCPMKPTGYAVVIEPLPDEDCGGFVASVPDLPGCLSDGETPEAALANVGDAIAAWVEAATDMGRPIPAPSRRMVTA